MNRKLNSLSVIFQSCILNRPFPEKWSYSDHGYAGNILLITNFEDFEAGLDSFLESSDGKFISKNFLKKIIERTLVGCEAHCDSNIAIREKWFKEHLKEIVKERNFNVVKTVFGGKIESSEQPVVLGPIIVYEVPRHAGYIKLPFSDPYFKTTSIKTVAEYCAQAKDADKALELANDVFNSFDLSIAFLLAERNLEFSIGILRMRFSPVQKPIVFTEGGLYGKEEKNYNFKPDLDLNSLADFCPDKTENTVASFFNVVLSPRTEIEKKISRAVQWIGEAYLDSNRSSAFLKVVVALEALFKIDESGVITASIMASMSEQCAYINGRSTDECIQIEAYVKSIYGLRSSIVHTGSSSVREAKLKKALDFARCTIFNLLAIKSGLKLETMKSLQELIRTGRYKACPLWQLA